MSDPIAARIATLLLLVDGIEASSADVPDSIADADVPYALVRPVSSRFNYAAMGDNIPLEQADYSITVLARKRTLDGAYPALTTDAEVNDVDPFLLSVPQVLLDRPQLTAPGLAGLAGILRTYLIAATGPIAFYPQGGKMWAAAQWTLRVERIWRRDVIFHE